MTKPKATYQQLTRRACKRLSNESLIRMRQMIAVVEEAQGFLVGKEKQQRIDQLRIINSVARKRLPAEFCNAVDDALLAAEDVASEETQ